MSVHRVSLIDVKGFGSGVLRVGDLNGDGAPDLLLVQSIYETREITCLTAITLEGEVLWQMGKPSSRNARGYSDLPVQVYDWDNDGANEVLYVRQAKYVGARPGIRERAERYEGDATKVVLDALTGKEKKHFSIPAPADDCFLFADLTGRGRRQDLVVKDRYWNMWGLSFEGKNLWHWKGSTGHFPAVADVDGKELWRAPLGEAQHVVGGRFRKESPVQFAVVDRGERVPAGVATLYLIDLAGKTLWKKTLPPGTWAAACREADVWGDRRQEVILFGPGGVCVYANARPPAVPTLYNETVYSGM